MSQTKKKSKDHAALAEIYSTHITQRCTNINEDLQRMYRKVCTPQSTYTYWLALMNYSGETTYLAISRLAAALQQYLSYLPTCLDNFAK